MTPVNVKKDNCSRDTNNFSYMFILFLSFLELIYLANFFSGIYTSQVFNRVLTQTLSPFQGSERVCLAYSSAFWYIYVHTTFMYFHQEKDMFPQKHHDIKSALYSLRSTYLYNIYYSVYIIVYIYIVYVLYIL